MDKAFEIQRQARDNVKTLQTYLTDLQNWETEMKRKEAALNGEFEQDLPPVRSKVKKDRPIVATKKPQQRISSFDYKSWDNFDADKACEEVDMEDVGPTSMDSNKSLQAKQEKLREEAQFEKERGNGFVKQEKWDEAISCYSRAIQLVKDDAIYYANRGLCYLKKDSLHQAEADCTEALALDPSYVKALQRRATARERLGSLRAASRDLAEVLRLEPHNAAAQKQLQAITARMGTKGSKSKSSPSSTPTSESKSFATEDKPLIVELTTDQSAELNVPTELDKWKDGIGEDITVIKTVKKPPHLRSKRPLKSIPIQEIQLGKTEPDKPATRLEILEIDDPLARGDTNNNEQKDEKISSEPTNKPDVKFIEPQDIENMNNDVFAVDKGVVNICVKNLTPPDNSVQFIAEWKYFNGNVTAKSDYLSIIDPNKIPNIFDNALESDILSDLLEVLNKEKNREHFKEKTVTAYLKGLSRVKRLSAIMLFLQDNDKKALESLLEYCKKEEDCSDKDIAEIKNKFEL